LGGVVKALESSIGLKIHVDLSFDLGKILVNILVSGLELLLGEFGYLSRHHALLVLEEAIRSSKEAIESHNFLKESKLGVGLVLRFGRLLRFDGFLDSRVDLSVDLFG